MFYDGKRKKYLRVVGVDAGRLEDKDPVESLKVSHNLV
jgi:hypothetical protein